MMLTRSIAAAVLSLVACISPCFAYFPTTPVNYTHKQGYAGVSVRYKEVPLGICETVEGVRSFSGYFDVGHHEHLFFWFFEARNGAPEEAPLSVWINGGPGSSSMIGLFQEHGPCGIRNNEVIYNEYSWNNVSNMLYIDQPVGVGFSYAKAGPGYFNHAIYEDLIGLPSEICPEFAKIHNTCGKYSLANATTTSNSSAIAAVNFWKAIQGFMGVFPQYSRNEFHFTTESYGGHYAPVFSEYFLEQNAKAIKGAHKIRLKTVSIINGWINPLIQYISYYRYGVFPGNTFDVFPLNDTSKHELHNALYGPGNCIDQVKLCKSSGQNDVCSYAQFFCSLHVLSPFIDASGRDVYDIRELTPDPFPYDDYKDYLNTAKIQQAIGAFVNFTEASQEVYDSFTVTGDDARDVMTTEDILNLLKNNVTVTLWAGDADFICNWFGVEAVANFINPPGFTEAGYAKIETSDDVTHGVTKQSGRFSFSRIYNAGHEIPFYQPLAALTVFNRSIHGLDIATGKTQVDNAYRTKGPHRSNYRQGNFTVQTTVLDENATYNATEQGPNPSSIRLINLPTFDKKGKSPRRLFDIRRILAKKSKARRGPRKQTIPR